jgi:hypothetical protein
MNNQQQPATWQEFLRQLIASPYERERLAAAVRVRPITLQRWVEGVSRPREENIRTLLKNLPSGDYPLFMRLLMADFPELRQDNLPVERFSEKLPSEFYARALSNLALTPLPIYRQSMQDLLSQQILEHLDPDRRGISVSLAVCVPPRLGRKVRSLREIGGLGTPPWPHDLAEKPMFLGSESLAGYAIQHMRSYVINNREEMTIFPAHWTEHERSSAAFPILRQAQITGCLIISSVQEYFFTPSRLAVIESYAHLAGHIFEPEDAFRSEDIDLWPMPQYVSQLPYFASYNQRISQKFVEAGIARKQISLQQVRQLVWQDIEDALLQLALQAEITN